MLSTVEHLLAITQGLIRYCLSSVVLNNLTAVVAILKSQVTRGYLY